MKDSTELSKQRKKKKLIDEYEEPVKKCTRCGIVLRDKNSKNVGQCLPCFAKDQFGDEEE